MYLWKLLCVASLLCQSKRFMHGAPLSSPCVSEICCTPAGSIREVYNLYTDDTLSVTSVTTVKGETEKCIQVRDRPIWSCLLPGVLSSSFYESLNIACRFSNPYAMGLVYVVQVMLSMLLQVYRRQ